MTTPFLKVLFDENFSEFITRRVAKFFYVVYLAILGLYTAFVMIFGVWLLVQRDIVFGLLAILLAPLSGLLLLMLGRLLFESWVALVLVAENTQRMVNQQNNIDN